ncbi:MAG TPA: phosphatase PAP2 family protein [Bacteroidia bacterium]|nr:phosphatase PAP2 family protein [Bacteroidia bacterium]HNS12328.1 phosphatase PAP2 family protein [Bacteroidia bacterium]
MLQVLNEIDVALFLFLNQLHLPILDPVFFWISHKYFWIPLYMYLFWYLYKYEKKDFVALLFAIVLAITLSDQISTSVLKNNIMRLRPCHNPDIASQVHIVRNYCGGLYGFVSSHASNSFALFAFVMTLVRGRVWAFRHYFLFWACINSYSRIYMGVHYPGDVIGGVILGLLIGYILAKIYLYYKKIRRPTLPVQD